MTALYEEDSPPRRCHRDHSNSSHRNHALTERSHSIHTSLQSPHHSLPPLPYPGPHEEEPYSPNSYNSPSRKTSRSSAITRVSQIPRLPTPDFNLNSRRHAQSSTQTRPLAAIRSTLARGLSFITFDGGPSRTARPSSPRLTTHPVRRSHRNHLPPRTEIESETATLVSARSVRSTASSATIVVAPRTEKLTRKFPRLRPGRQMQTGASGDGVVDASPQFNLEDGMGLGLESFGGWNSFKWFLFLSVLTVFTYAATAMSFAISTWFRAWEYADVMLVSDNDVLVLITLAGSILLVTALLGLAGTLLNSRPILATYTVMLWPGLMALLSVGYTSYRRSALSLDHKLNFAWSQSFTHYGRFVVQNSLRCCGYHSPLHSATLSSRCYPRTRLPGCKSALYHFEKANLGLIWSATFSVVALHLLNIVVALLCSNHVTKIFGTRMIPKPYRLRGADVMAEAEKLKATPFPLSKPGRSLVSSSTLIREDRA